LLGKKLYGDDFTPEEIDAWFRDEEEGYYNLGAKDRSSHRYLHHALDWMHGFSALPRKSFRHVLGFGSAYGDEFLPIASGVSRITILEPSDGFVVKDIGGTSVEYVKPAPNGRMPFADGSFDLITCLAVLHHIPNVSAVIGEIFRCLEPGGVALIREPVSSMGDWRQPRKGLTSRERGIPLSLLRKMISQAGFQVLRESPCVFPLTSRLNYFLKPPVFNSKFWTYADGVVSRLPLWPERYHRARWFHKFAPSCAFFVLQKSS
jgi:SAM-dependent methyltransferase